jgi:hypothetical protein
MRLPSKQLASQIVQNLGQYGTPLSRGVSYYNVGTESILDALEKHYLSSYLPEGGAAFKLVVGDYGSGKSHFLYCLRERAWAHRYAVSYVSLSPRECPYDDQKKVYGAVAKALTWHDPNRDDSEPTTGLADFLQRLLEDILVQYGVPLGSDEALELDEVKALLESFKNAHIDSTIYHYAVKGYLEAVLRGDAERQEVLSLWLHGEELSTAHMGALRQLNVTDKLSRSNAFQMLRSLAQSVRALGFTGMCLLFDEMERLSLLSKRAMHNVADNLREVIDRTREDLPGTLFIYAVVPKFVSDVVPLYPALQQRLQAQAGRYFSDVNPFSPRIDLERLDLDEQTLLVRIAERLLPIFEIAYEARLNHELQAQNAHRLAQAALSFRFGTSHRRIFVKSLIAEWYRQLREGEVLLSDAQASEIVGSSGKELDSETY